MNLSAKGIEFLKAREGFRTKAYYDGTGWAIGYGNMFYEDGRPVKQGDTITAARAETLFKSILKGFENGVSKAVTSDINQSQFDALVSYAYNRGLARFRSTQLLKMINANPKNPAIREQFATEWGTNTRYKDALIARRKLEADLYFSEVPATNTASLSTWIFGGLALGLILSR